MEKWTTDLFISKSKEIHGDKYDYSQVVYVNYDTKVKIILDGIVYEQTPHKHLMGRCPEKNTARKTTEQFITEAREKWGDKYDYSLVEYKNALSKIKIIYNDKVYEQVATSHLRYAPENNKSDTDNFIELATNIHGDRYDYSLVEYINANSKVKIIHKNKIYEQTPTTHLSGARPENIHLSIRKTTETFIRESVLVHSSKYDYSKVEYFKSQIKVIILCPIHGEFKQTPLSHIRGYGCPHCSESRGEKTIAKYLKDNHIPFIRQKKFTTCRNVFELPFDFWIPSKKVLIEYDGEQHFKANEHFGGQQAFANLKANDAIKTSWCLQNNIELIRISYYEADKIPMILDMSL
jgi:very-short-patch-repair endonuclease